MQKNPPQPLNIPPPPGRVADILGIRVPILSRSQILSAGKQLLTSDGFHHVVTANSLLILEAQKNDVLKEICQSASLVVSDSSGISWASRTLGSEKPERFPGIDFAQDLCGLAEQLELPVYLLGGKPGVPQAATTHLKTRFVRLNIVGSHDGYFHDADETAVLEDIRRAAPRLVLVALGMPKQELWIWKNRHELFPALYIGVGGSLDIWAGILKRAPSWAREGGFEWFFRLIQEPRRWPRIGQLPVFAMRVLAQRCRRGLSR